MFDGGWPRDGREIVASLQAIGAKPTDVRSLVLTHAHRDHMGTAVELHRRHGIVTRCLSAEEELALGRRHEGADAKALLPYLWRPSVVAVSFYALTRGGLSGAPSLDSVETFEDREVLDLPGRPVAIATPGHTSGHTVFHLPDAGVLITGDALVADDLMGDRSGPRIIHDVFNHDPAEARRSLDRMVGIEADVLLPGHGDPIRMSPAEAVAAARAADR